MTPSDAAPTNRGTFALESTNEIRARRYLHGIGFISRFPSGVPFFLFFSIFLRLWRLGHIASMIE